MARKKNCPDRSFTGRSGKENIEKKELALANIGLVYSMANSFARKGEEARLSVDDLIQEGFFGLIDAVEKFDLEKGYEFSTLACSLIKAAIFNAIKESLPRISMKENGTNRAGYARKELIEKVRVKFFMKNGRYPKNDKELRDHIEKEYGLRLLLKTIQFYRGLQFPVSIYGLDGDPDEGGCILDKADFSESTSESELTHGQTENLLGCLKPEYRKVVVLHLGLLGNKPKSFEALAKGELGGTKQCLNERYWRAISILEKTKEIKIILYHIAFPKLNGRMSHRDVLREMCTDHIEKRVHKKAQELLEGFFDPEEMEALWLSLGLTGCGRCSIDKISGILGKTRYKTNKILKAVGKKLKSLQDGKFSRLADFL